MHFCKDCSRAMRRDCQSGRVVFRCPCGTEEVGSPADARIFGGVLGSTETAEMYSNLIRHAAFDRTNQLVKKHCPVCRRDYMTQIRVGDSEVIVYKCKCGYTITGAGGQAAESPRTGGPTESPGGPADSHGTR